MTSEKNYIRGHIEALTAISQKQDSEESDWFKPSEVVSLLKEHRENKMFLSTATRHHKLFERQHINRRSTTFKYKLKENVRDEIRKINESF